MIKLCVKLYSMYLEEEINKRQNVRKIQIGSKGRLEKIRIYNFLQNWVIDYRINKMLYDFEIFM